MPDMPTWIAKGNILIAVDNADANTLKNIRQDLMDGVPVDQVASRNLPLTEAAIEHLREDWFKPSGWFGYDASQVIREAFIHAINVVNPGGQGPVRPLDCYWVCWGGEDRTTEVAVSGKPGSVVVIIKTPVPDRPPVRAGTVSKDEPFRLVYAGREPYSPQYREI